MKYICKKILILFIILTFVISYETKIVYGIENVSLQDYSRLSFAVYAPDGTIHDFESINKVDVRSYGNSKVVRTYNTPNGIYPPSGYGNPGIVFFRHLDDGRIFMVQSYYSTNYGYTDYKYFKVWYVWDGSSYVRQNVASLDGYPSGSRHGVSGYGIMFNQNGSSNGYVYSYGYFFNGSDLEYIPGYHYTNYWTASVASDKKVYIVDNLNGNRIFLSDNAGGPIYWNGGAYNLDNYPYFKDMLGENRADGAIWHYKRLINGSYWYYSNTGDVYIPSAAIGDPKIVKKVYTGQIDDMVYINGKYVILAQTLSYCQYSYDLDNWVQFTMPQRIADAESNSSGSIALGRNYNSILRTTDGINWTTISTSEYGGSNLAVAGDTFIYGSFSGIRYSTDGINWTTVTSSLGSGQKWVYNFNGYIYCYTYDSDISMNRVYRSPVSDFTNPSSWVYIGDATIDNYNIVEHNGYIYTRHWSSIVRGTDGKTFTSAGINDSQLITFKSYNNKLILGSASYTKFIATLDSSNNLVYFNNFINSNGMVNGIRVINNRLFVFHTSWGLIEVILNQSPTMSLGFQNGVTYYYNNDVDIWTWGTATDGDGDNIKVSAVINGHYAETTVASGQTWYLVWDISTLPVQEGTFNNIQFTASDGKSGSSNVIFTGNFVVDKTAPATPIIRYGY